MRTSILSSCLLLLALVGSLAVPEPARAGTPGPAVATVNGKPILVSALEKELSSMVTGLDGKHTEAQKREALDILVEQEIFCQKAVSLGYDQDPRVRRMLIRSYIEDHVVDKLPADDVNEQEARAWYREHKADFDSPEMVRALRIMVRVEAPRTDAQARAELERYRAMVLQDPANTFKKVAEQHSEDPNKARGGDTGFIVRGRPSGVDPAVAEKALGMQEGQVSEAFRSVEGWNILYVSERRAAKVRTYPEVKGLVARAMKRDRLEQAEKAHIKELQKQVRVEVDARTLESTDAHFKEGARLKSRGDDDERDDERP